MICSAALCDEVFVRDRYRHQPVSEQSIGFGFQFTTKRCELNLFLLKSAVGKKILGCLFVSQFVRCLFQQSVLAGELLRSTI